MPGIHEYLHPRRLFLAGLCACASLRAAEDPVSSWDFDGTLTDSAGAIRESFQPQGGAVRFVSAAELPGTAGQALALGVAPGDAAYFTVPASADTRLDGTYTIEAWVHPTAVSPDWNRLLLDWAGERGYHLAIHGGRASLYHAQSDGTERVAEGGELRPHRWYCLTAVASRSAATPAQSTISIYLNGKILQTTPCDGTTRQTSTAAIGLGDAADGSAASLRFHGFVDAVRLWQRALSPTEIGARCAARQAALELPSRAVAVVRELRQRSPLAAAAALARKADELELSDELAEIAAELLDHDDVCVRALAEWALAQKVGYDNAGGTVTWSGSEDAPWLQRWLQIPRQDFVEFDWIRHAHARGVLDSAAALRDEIAALAARAEQTAAAVRPEERGRVALCRDSIRTAVREAGQTDDVGALRRLWLDCRRALRPIVFARREVDFDRLLFCTRYAPHHKPNVCGVHYNWVYKPGGDLAVLTGLADSREPEMVLRGRLGPGHVHGLDLWFDADRVVFGWAKQPDWPPRRPDGTPYDLCHPQNNYAFELMKVTEPLHLYEAALDGNGIQQLTADDYWSDLEPTYLPDGAIVFSSDRSGHSPSCDGWENDITDLNLYRMEADRGQVRRLANHKDIDMHPHLLDNGLLAYLRWEYQERDFWDTHSVWTMRPDGTLPDALFKQHLPFPTSVREARSIPGSNSLVAIAAGHHCYPVGPIVRLTPSAGMNRPEAIDIIAMGSPPQERAMAGTFTAAGGVRDGRGYYSTPYALSPDCYLASFGFGSGRPRPGKAHGNTDLLANDSALYLLDTAGNKELVFRDRFLCALEPLPLRARPRPPTFPAAATALTDSATCIVADVYQGLDGIERGTVKYLRILEALPWPLTRESGSRYYGGQSFAWQVNQERNWTPIRIIGTVPVEADGSAHFKVPTTANASVAFQALDSRYQSVQRMRSSVSFQPGEVRGCTGCHETRATAPGTGARPGSAARRPPDLPEQPSWGYRPLGYEWMIQPILSRHCASCHGGTQPKADLDLSDQKRTPFGQDSMLASYVSILSRNLIVSSNQRLDGAVTPPKQFGAYPSPLIQHLLNDAEHAKCELSTDEWYRLVTWVDANGPYYDQLYNKRPADGGAPRREPFAWRHPWGEPDRR